MTTRVGKHVEAVALAPIDNASPMMIDGVENEAERHLKDFRHLAPVGREIHRRFDPAYDGIDPKTRDGLGRW
jgi:hypothetical protein